MAGPSNDWERLGALEPYFAVLTEERFLRENLTPERLEEFYASGERDVAWFLSLAARVRGEAPPVRSALELGCGVGRLCLPLARRGVRVTGVDVAPSMLAAARARAAAEGLAHAAFLPVEVLGELPPQSFDLVLSYIVFQHIPPSQGERYLRQVLRLAAPGGTVLLHFTLRRPGTALRRALRELRSRSPLVHRLAVRLRGERDLPYMQMNEYEAPRLLELFAEAGLTAPAIVPTDHGGIPGAIFAASRPPAPAGK